MIKTKLTWAAVLALAFGILSVAHAAQNIQIPVAPSAKGKPLAEKPLVKITGLGILYCTSSTNCEWTSKFKMGKVPFAIGIALESRPEAKGRAIDFAWEIRDVATGQPVFQDYQEGTIDTIPTQRFGYRYAEIPAELNQLRKDGKYRLIVTALSADGAVSSQAGYPLRVEEAAITSRESTAGSEWGECITISTGSDNGAADCALSIISGPYRNSSTAEVFTNLGTCLSTPKTATIIGHANDGYMCTGGGDKCGGSDNTVMHPKNGAKWIPLAAGIKDKDTELTLGGCIVGAGDDGASLLYKLAQATNRNVRGPTGLLRCSPKQKRMWIEGVWQVATPTKKPAPIPAPPHFVRPSGFSYFSIGANKTRVEVKNVQLVKISLFANGTLTDVKNQFRINESDVLSLIDFAHPEITEDQFFAAVTGELTFEITSGTKQIEKQFKILANSIVQDIDNPTYFYRIDSRLHERLASAIHFLNR